MTRIHALFTFVAALHLLIVILGATRTASQPGERDDADSPRLSLLAPVQYGRGLFIHNVGPQLRVVFVLQDASGKTWTDELNHSPKSDHRLFVGLGGNSAKPEKVSLSAWAETMLCKHTRAEQVVIRVEVFDLPEAEKAGRLSVAEWRLVQEFGPFSRDEEQQE